MSELLFQYGLFLLKAATVVAAFVFLIAIGFSISKRTRASDQLKVNNLNDKYDNMASVMQHAVLPKKAFKKAAKKEKARKKQRRELAVEPDHPRRRLFVINFHGDIKATAVSALREEITAVLTMATENDEVLVRLENYGGLVHEHGLAASQLKRFRDRNIPLTVSVDKVAASGGYLMACVADRIIAAPFAVIGSIGVLAQLPNFHRMLDRHGIEFEQIKAGDLKRTLTMFGVNTEEDREHFSRQLEDTHQLFKQFVADHRATVDIDAVSTGEHWYGSRALEMNLIDGIRTSDDHLIRAARDADLFEVIYTPGKTVSEKLASVIQGAVERVFVSWIDRSRQDKYLV
ncbi:MAG: protease SohB [Gammaproteobacteria bacterium]|jgi:serine protease SohB|nr:protease SohB [Gammaproteobacteria bacterium]